MITIFGTMKNIKFDNRRCVSFWHCAHFPKLITHIIGVVRSNGVSVEDKSPYDVF